MIELNLTSLTRALGLAGVNEFRHERCFFWRLGRHRASPRHVGRRYRIAEGSVPAQRLEFSHSRIGYDWCSFGMLRLKVWKPSVNTALCSGVRLASWDVIATLSGKPLVLYRRKKIGEQRSYTLGQSKPSRRRGRRHSGQEAQKAQNLSRRSHILCCWLASDMPSKDKTLHPMWRKLDTSVVVWPGLSAADSGACLMSEQNNFISITKVVQADDSSKHNSLPPSLKRTESGAKLANYKHF